MPVPTYSDEVMGRSGRGLSGHPVQWGRQHRLGEQDRHGSHG